MWVFTAYFSLVPILSFNDQIHRLHASLHLNLSPYILPSRLHMQLVYVPVCTWTDAVDVTDQDCMYTLCYTILVGNTAC